MASQTVVKFPLSIGDMVRHKRAPNRGEVVGLGIFEGGILKALVDGHESGKYDLNWTDISRLEVE